MTHPNMPGKPPAVAAFSYVGRVGGEPVAHVAVSTRPGHIEAHVCRLILPEWQGVGFGRAVQGFRYREDWDQCAPS